MDQYGCYGSILSRDSARASCASCNLFQDCGVEGERVRKALNEKWGVAAELAKLDSMIAKSKGLPTVEALEEITEIWKGEDLNPYEKVRLIIDRCPNNRSIRNIERWHGWGVDTQDIRKGINPFRKEAEPFAFLFVEELLERGATDEAFHASIAKQMKYKPAATIAQINTMTTALYAASVLEKRDGVFTLRRAT